MARAPRPAEPPAVGSGVRTIRFGGALLSAPSGRSADSSQDGPRYPLNVLVTSKYTWYDFVPKNLWEQLHKAANVYFLLISFVMFLGNITTWTGGTPLFYCIVKFYSTFLALFVMMVASAVMAAIDDIRRHQADDRTNSQLAVVVRLTDGGKTNITAVQWKHVAVGDILVVRGEEEFPADLVPLAASGEEGCCYVSTANLDGETNLKIKTAAPSTQLFLCGGRPNGRGSANGSEPPLLEQAVSRLAALSGVVQAEAPQKSIHNFAGSVRVGTGTEEALGPKQLLLRGTRLRNTSWCLGLCIYTGPQTRMVMNSRKAKPKLANLELVINTSMLVVVTAQAILALVSDILYCATLEEYLQYWYLFPDGQKTKIILPQPIGYWLTFFVLYSNLMPISLYFTMEVCNAAQAYFIKSDLEMYDAAQDCPANARSTNLGHELGQVSYVFSDKTGTLTQNVMELKRLSIGGRKYGEVDERTGFQAVAELMEARRPGSSHADSINGLLEVLAVSHTVVATRGQDGRLRYEAESPDEGALVEAVSGLGWTFTGRTSQSITVLVGGEELVYELLALNAFTSSRKRQSVVVRRPNGERVLLVKGADDIMRQRAADPGGFPEEHLSEFAREGLRTLVLGRRTLPDAEFTDWYAQYTQAQTAMTQREEALAAAAELVERSLDIVGVTAIEDKLQVGVQETIERIREAGIKLWVLTGDKLETARNIGFSTRVLTEEMEIMVLDVDGRHLDDRLTEVDSRAERAVSSGTVAALMVTGQALEEITSAHVLVSSEPTASSRKDAGGKIKALSPTMRRFLDIAQRCSVVIACRVAPIQKSELVRLVRKGVRPTPVTLAIGDGANDVPMIQEAQVGVGISGKEGRQAVNSADFSIAQFRYLQRLLLVHGMWNYRRACKFVLYSFWKNAVLVLLMFYYTFVSGFAGTSLFEDMVRASYNFVLAAPIIATGIFDQDVSARAAMENPMLYDIGRLGLDLNPIKLVEMLLSAFVHSVIILSVMSLALPGFDAQGVSDYYSFGTIVFTVLVIAMNYRAAFLTRTWNWLTLAAQAFSYVLYIVLILVAYCLLESTADAAEPWMYNVTTHILRSSLFWVCALTVPALAMVMDAFKAYLVSETFPDSGQLARELAELKRPQRVWRTGTCSSTTSAPVPRAPPTGSGAILARSATASSFDFAHPGDVPRGPGAFQGHPTAGDTSLLDGVRPSPSSSFPSVEVATPHEAPSEYSAGSDVEEGSRRPGENRPDGSAFAQQALPSCQMRITGSHVFAAACSIGVLLLAMGAAVWGLSQGTPQLIVVYAGEAQAWRPGGAGHPEAAGDFECGGLRPGETRSCTFAVPVRWQLRPPILVRYVVTPFYMNYPQYLSSGSSSSGAWDELRGTLPTADWRSKHCRGGGQTAVAADGRLAYPCGLQATSVFNDTFELWQSSGEAINVDLRGLAWRSDQRRMNNPPEYGQPGTEYSWLSDRYPASVVDPLLGVKDERFVAWMRPEALPQLSRLYGRVGAEIPEGNLTIRINASFPVEHLGAQKQLILESETFLGRCDGFGIFLASAGLVCWAAAAVVAVIRMSCPRRPGKARFRCGAPSRRFHADLGQEEEESTGEEESDDDASESGLSSDEGAAPRRSAAYAREPRLISL